MAEPFVSTVPAVPVRPDALEVVAAVVAAASFAVAHYVALWPRVPVLRLADVLALRPFGGALQCRAARVHVRGRVQHLAPGWVVARRAEHQDADLASPVCGWIRRPHSAPAQLAVAQKRQAV